MKKLFYLLLIIGISAGIFSCTKEKKEVQKWEYLTISSVGYSWSDFRQRSIDLIDAELDSLGNQGWELVDVYTRVETVHPNFGNERYVTGLQPNTRTSCVYYVFKRPKVEGVPKTKDKKVPAESVRVDSVICDSI